MGQGFSIECNKCGFSFDASFGIGFMFPMESEEMIEKGRSGELGEEVKTFLENNKCGAIDVKRVVLRCEECGNLEIGHDLSMYVPDDDKYDPDSEEKGIWSIAVLAEGMKYVSPMDLEEHYKKILDYPHKCSKCSGKMKIIKEEEFDKIPCPECDGTMNQTDGHFYWD